MVLYKQDKESVTMKRLKNMLYNYMSKWLYSKPTTLPVKETVVEYTRLRQDQYLRLERLMSRPLVDSATSELQAGYIIGVQAVLKELRDGFVSGS